MHRSACSCRCLLPGQPYPYPYPCPYHVCLLRRRALLRCQRGSGRFAFAFPERQTFFTVQLSSRNASRPSTAELGDWGQQGDETRRDDVRAGPRVRPLAPRPGRPADGVRNPHRSSHRRGRGHDLISISSAAWAVETLAPVPAPPRSRQRRLQRGQLLICPPPSRTGTCSMHSRPRPAQPGWPVGRGARLRLHLQQPAARRWPWPALAAARPACMRGAPVQHHDWREAPIR